MTEDADEDGTPDVDEGGSSDATGRAGVPDEPGALNQPGESADTVDSAVDDPVESSGTVGDDTATRAPPERSDERDRTRDRADDPAVLREEIERLREEIESLEAGVESRTVTREALERDLKRYVRRRVRRGHARGWGPYLVLGYGTAMTIAAYAYLSSGWAILAMFLIWTSTLGVYLLMLVFATAFTVVGLPGRLRDRLGEWRS